MRTSRSSPTCHAGSRPVARRSTQRDPRRASLHRRRRIAGSRGSLDRARPSGRRPSPEVDRREAVDPEELRDLAGMERVVAAQPVQDRCSRVVLDDIAQPALERDPEIVDRPARESSRPRSPTSSRAPRRARRRDRGVFGLVLPAHPARIGERRAVRTALAEDVAEPVHPCAGTVRGELPDRPVVGAGTDRELLVGQVADAVAQSGRVPGASLDRGSRRCRP